MEEGNRAALQAAQAALAGLFQRCQQRVGSHDCTAVVVGQLMREGVAMVGEQVCVSTSLRGSCFRFELGDYENSTMIVEYSKSLGRRGRIIYFLAINY